MATATVDTVVIGAGQAGLAVSWHLQKLGLDHVVLDRGRIAERWRSERWDSLRTLTPNWMTRLPGSPYDGPEPDGFMTMPELAARFGAYARSFAAPVEEGVTVEAVTTYGDGFQVRAAGAARWRARNVVIATGWCDVPHVPALADRLPAGVQQLTVSTYRNPDQLTGDQVLVVGASASGAQIARELATSGRRVTVAVGRHRRVPRRYRGQDIMWWLDRLGILDRPPVDEAERRRLLGEPSAQLSASATLDLTTLDQLGVTLAGHLAGVEHTRAWFASDLDATVSDAETRMRRVLAQIDTRAARLGMPQSTDLVPPPVDARHAPASMSLGTRGVDAIVWATGFRRAYPWLHIPVLDAYGEIRHERGITPVPGLYATGMRFQSGRRSTFIDGARLDAPLIVDAIARRARFPLAA